MGVFDSIKGIFNIPDEDDYDEELEQTASNEEPKKSFQYSEQPQKKTEGPTRVVGGKSRTVTFSQSQMQVVLVKPERYDDVTSIADHLNEKKTVVLNLESADKDLSRRIVDFLSGATYANHGNMRKVSRGTFLIVPNGVDMMGDLMLEDFEEGRMYF